MSFVNQPSVGRAESCPDGATDVVDDRLGYGPNAVKCSYADANGTGITTIGGSVRADDGGLGIAVEGVVVTIHAVSGPPNPDSPGPSLGDATTDPQGGFRFSARLEAGDYLIVVRDAEGGPALTFKTVFLEEATRREVLDVMLLLPQDERLVGEGPATSE